MVAPQSIKTVARQLKKSGFTLTDCSGRGPHTKWTCPCGQHFASVPRHGTISPGTMRDISHNVKCLPFKWLLTGG